MKSAPQSHVTYGATSGDGPASACSELRRKERAYPFLFSYSRGGPHNSTSKLTPTARSLGINRLSPQHKTSPHIGAESLTRLLSAEATSVATTPLRKLFKTSSSETIACLYHTQATVNVAEAGECFSGLYPRKGPVGGNPLTPVLQPVKVLFSMSIGVWQHPPHRQGN